MQAGRQMQVKLRSVSASHLSLRHQYWPCSATSASLSPMSRSHNTTRAPLHTVFNCRYRLCLLPKVCSKLCSDTILSTRSSSLWLVAAQLASGDGALRFPQVTWLHGLALATIGFANVIGPVLLSYHWHGSRWRNAGITER